MDDRTRGLFRDGSLALLALAAMLDVLRRRDRIDTLLDPAALLPGVVGAIVVEALMLRDPERTRDLWERPLVRVASLGGTVAVGRTLARQREERAVAAVCWGLLTYLLLLGVVLSGRENPVSSVRRAVENGSRQS
ncbi:hypothetical protein ACFQE8_18795 [Salinirubellus sp. GCM10025818]|jgi:hypothetical protein|uniref:hypothetical protein n=1 Tax=Salinirubellus TaxID=2162630 RepID=UPI0030CB3126